MRGEVLRSARGLRCVWLALLLALCAGAPPVTAQPAPPTAGQPAAPQAAPPVAPGPAPEPAQPGAPAPVDADPLGVPSPGEMEDLVEATIGAPSVAFTYQNRDILTLRTTIFGRTPRERADIATLLLDRLVEAQTIAPVTTRTVAGGGLIYVAGGGILAVVEGDLDGAAVSLDAGMAAAAKQLELALQEALELRSPGQLLHALARAAIATLILLAVLRGLSLLRRRLLLIGDARLDPTRAASRRDEPVEATKYGAHHLRRLLLRAARLLLVLLGLVALWTWFTWTLLQFPYLRPFGESLNEELREPLLKLLDAALDAIPGLIVAGVILFAARLFVRGSNAFFEAVRVGKVSVPWVDAEVAQPTRRIVNFAIWIFAVVLAFPYLPGSGTDAFRGMTVFLGIVLSLGSTGVVSQLISGIMLMYARIVRVGDYVRVGEDEGTVTHISLLTTRLRTPWSEELVLPNTSVLSKTTLNFSRFRDDGGVRVHADVTIGYDAPWRQVHAMLLRAAARTAGIRRHPEPLVVQRTLSDFYVGYRLSVAPEEPAERIHVLSALFKNIQDEFNEHGVQIMSPHFMANPGQPVVVPQERWFAPPAAAAEEASPRSAR